MYGVVWITPPKVPATRLASASVQSTWLVSYSSPAAAADSVQSIPPTTVARANGSATGKRPNASAHTWLHQAQPSAPKGQNAINSMPWLEGHPNSGTTRAPVQCPKPTPIQ